MTHESLKMDGRAVYIFAEGIWTEQKDGSFTWLRHDAPAFEFYVPSRNPALMAEARESGGNTAYAFFAHGWDDWGFPKPHQALRHVAVAVQDGKL